MLLLYHKMTEISSLLVYTERGYTGFGGVFMSKNLTLSPMDFQKFQTAKELETCNALTLKFGLYLSQEQIARMVEKRVEALQETGRIEFGEGMIKKIIFEFCDSPFIWQDTYEETIFELLDSFYYFKNDSLDIVSDDELIKFMKIQFDLHEGDIDYLNGTSLEKLSSYVKNGFCVDDREGELFRYRKVGL